MVLFGEELIKPIYLQLAGFTLALLINLSQSLVSLNLELSMLIIC